MNTPYTGDPGGDGENGLRTGGDAMAFSLGYYQDDYTPIGSGITLSDTRDNLWTRYQED